MAKPPKEPRNPTTPRAPKDPSAAARPKQPKRPAVVAPSDDDVDGDEKKAKDKCATFPTDSAAIEPKITRSPAFLGFDHMNVPQSKNVTAEEALRWIHLVSNWRFAGIYMQGSAPKDVKIPVSTDIDKHNRQWMNEFDTVEDGGFGTAPIFLAVSNHHGLGDPRVPMTGALGKQHGLFARDLASQLVDMLGIDMTGCVVYVDNEDVGGTQEYEKSSKDDTKVCRLKESQRAEYLAYHRALATELMRPVGGVAFRVGLYTHPAVVEVLSAAMPELYAWVVQQPKKLAWSTILSSDEKDVPLTVSVATDNTPRHQRLDVAPSLMWPVLRQFALDIEVDQQFNPPVPLAPDISGSFVCDPSDPYATPRLAYLAGTTMLVRNRMASATFSDGYAKYKSTKQTKPRRGLLTVLEGGTTVGSTKTTLDMPLNNDAEQIHPESPVLTTADGNARTYVGVVRRDRGILVGEIVAGQANLLELVPGSFARRPFAVAIAGVRTQIVVFAMTKANKLSFGLKVWPFGKWFQMTAVVDVHPLSGLAASSNDNGDRAFYCGVSETGKFFAQTVSCPVGNAVPAFFSVSFPGSPPPLCVTSALAAASPTANDHLGFAISKTGTLVCFWTDLNTSTSGFLESGKQLHLHSQLGAVVESSNRVHAAGIDVDGNVRRWAFAKKSAGGWDFDGDSVVSTKGSTAAPNPYTDIAMASTGVDLGFVAVAGVDESDDNPDTRAHAFRASFGTTSWERIPNG